VQLETSKVNTETPNNVQVISGTGPCKRGCWQCIARGCLQM